MYFPPSHHQYHRHHRHHNHRHRCTTTTTPSSPRRLWTTATQHTASRKAATWGMVADVLADVVFRLIVDIRLKERGYCAERATCDMLEVMKDLLKDLHGEELVAGAAVTIVLAGWLVDDRKSLTNPRALMCTVRGCARSARMGTSSRAFAPFTRNPPCRRCTWRSRKRGKRQICNLLMNPFPCTSYLAGSIAPYPKLLLLLLSSSSSS
jgi:hypothetical protein